MSEEANKIEEEVKNIIISVPSNEPKSLESPKNDSVRKAKFKRSPSSWSRERKVASRYLNSTYTSSCHHFCKYGKHHEAHMQTLPIIPSCFSFKSFQGKSIEMKVIRRPELKTKNNKEVTQNDSKNSESDSVLSLSTTDKPESASEGSEITDLETALSHVSLSEEKTPSREKNIEVVKRTPLPKIAEKKSSSSIKKPIMTMSPEPNTKKTSAPKFSNNKAASSSKTKTAFTKSTSAVDQSSKRLSTPRSIKGKSLMKRLDSASKPPRSASKSEVGAKVEAKEEMEEKTTHVIEQETPDEEMKNVGMNDPSEARTSSVSSLSSWENTEKESEEEKKIRSSQPLKKLKVLASNKEFNFLSPRKLCFRRGRVLSPRNENNSPRKLKFKQARSFRTRFSNDTSKEKKEAKVVLRHRDVEKKEEMQSLLNEVIEEMANKLVEVRKSKVKALVGAFETVISLLEK